MRGDAALIANVTARTKANKNDTSRREFLDPLFKETPKSIVFAAACGAASQIRGVCKCVPTEKCELNARGANGVYQILVMPVVARATLLSYSFNRRSCNSGSGEKNSREKLFHCWIRGDGSLKIRREF